MASSSSALPAKSRVRARHVDGFEYTFPAVRGVQAGREYYVTMCPLRLIPRLFFFEDTEVDPELRVQRNLNRARVPEIARYVTNNRDSYVFSALTASIDADVHFEPYGNVPGARRVGTLYIPMSARFILNDGQHRRAAIERALQDKPDLGEESIAIVLFLDLGLKRCQQMFADLNRHAIRPSRSLGVLYDHRDAMSAITRLMVMRAPMLRVLTEAERASLSERSRKLFSLSSFYTANRALLEGAGGLAIERRADAGAEYWEIVASQFPEWERVYVGDLAAGWVRRSFIHSHAIVLHALGRVGSTLLGPELDAARRGLEVKLRRLSNIDWRRDAGGMWEGRAMTGGAVCKSNAHVLLTTAAIRTELGLPLPPAEARAESILRGGDS